METPRFVWFLMRGSGLVALMLFTLTVVLGVVGVTRLQSPRWPRLVTGGLHRNVALTASCFLFLHIATALLDSWVGLGWIGALVPFHSRYRPVWLGLGVVAFYLFLAVLASSLLRRSIGARMWRFIHWGTWLMWPLALTHALGAGTDTARGWGLGICVVCVASVCVASVWRIGSASRRRSAGRSPRPTSGGGVIAPTLEPPRRARTYPAGALGRTAPWRPGSSVRTPWP
jgi:methionine sulfoxide reductase heme-binding subunit